MAYKFWSKEEEEFLKNNYKNLSIQELSKELNRSANSINLKAWKYGIKIVNTRNNEIDKKLRESKEFKIKLRLNDKVKISYISKKGNGRVVQAIGEVILINKYYFLIKTEKYKEAFLIQDLRSNKLKVEFLEERN